MTEDIKNVSFDELIEFLTQNGYPKFCAGQIFDWIYQKHVEDFGKMSNLSKKTREFLNENFYFSKIKQLKKEVAVDKTEKFLFQLEDAAIIETVLIPRDECITLCVSSQVGCKFGCKFCMSGQNGFMRDLSVAEIINQYLTINKRINPDKITNIVFMGIGEPLDNFDNVIRAITLLSSKKGINFSARRVTISTCGIVPRLQELMNLNLGIKLSISLHSGSDALRTQIMPINRKYPLEQLMRVLRKFSRQSKEPVTFEYVLLKGVNTKKEDVYALTKLTRGIRCKFNLIAYNKSLLNYSAPSDDEIENFKKELKRARIFSTLRVSRGEDISAACGQLKASWKQ